MSLWMKIGKLLNELFNELFIDDKGEDWDKYK